MSSRLTTHSPDAEPLTQWSAVAAGAAVTAGLTASVGLLWTALAFSSQEGWAYNHLALWIGGTLVVASAIGGLVAAVLSSRRGAGAGSVNGGVSGAVVTVVLGGIALAILGVNGSLDDVLRVGSQTVDVNFMRPYVAFWAGGGAMLAAAAGGVAGGLIPRRAAHNPVVELAPVPAWKPTTVVNTDRPAEAVSL